MKVSTNNTEVILKLEVRVSDLEKSMKIAKEFLNFVEEKDCSTHAWSYIINAKRHLSREESNE